MKAAAPLLLVVALACSRAPVVVEFPQTEGATVFVMTRSSVGTRFFASSAQTPETIIEFEEGEAQLLSFKQKLAAVGLSEGEVTSEELGLTAGLPRSLSSFTLSAGERLWSPASEIWPEAQSFRVAPSDVCPNYLLPDIEELEVPVQLQAAWARSSGELILVASSTIPGGPSEVYLKQRHQELVTVEADFESRLAITEIDETVWTGGTQLWKSEGSSGWNAVSVATSTALGGERVISLAGPVTIQGQFYEVVALTREGGFWGWTGSELLPLADGYPSEPGVAALRVNDELYFARFFEGRPPRTDNFLVRVGPSGFETALVAEEVTDNVFRSRPILGMATLDDRVFLAASNAAQLEDFEQGLFRKWSETNDTNFVGMLARENHLYLPTSRRALFASRSINGIQLNCDGQVARAASIGTVRLSKVFGRSGGLSWITQLADQGELQTQVLWLDEVQ